MNKKILVCDSEEGVRESVKLILSDDFDLLLVENGEQCLECLNKAKDIGLVLMDIKMPQTSGLDILKQIKEKYPDLKVIIITGYKSVETATEAVRVGASGYIVKPFKSDEVLAIIRKNFK